jgi:hypothetical protein
MYDWFTGLKEIARKISILAASLQLEALQGPIRILR